LSLNLIKNPKTKTMKKTLLTLALVGLAAVASHAQGTIQFANSGASPIKYQDVIGGPSVNAPDGCVIGVFWGTDAGTLTLQTPTTTTFTSAGVSGLYSGGAAYALTGTQPGQTVFLKIAGWLTKGGTTPAAITGSTDARITHYGESSVIQTLGLAPTTGPGIVVIQGPAGVNVNRVKPFVIAPVVPEPSVLALGALGLGALLLRRRKA
jgi:hypothetical protein